MKKVYIAHPLRGENREKNVQEVTRICQKITELFPDVLPISPIHAFSFLDDCGEEGEKKALDLCLELVKTCDEAWFFGEWEGSEGCNAEWATTYNADGKLMLSFDYSRPKAEEKADAYKSALSIDVPEKALVDWLLSEVYAGAEPLKPCPFCGGVAKVTAYGNEGTFSEGSVDCQNRHCPAYVRVCWGKHDICKTRAEAIAAWNRRAE